MTSPRDALPTATSSPFSPKRVLVLFGTRPEAIKLCPLVRSLLRRSATLETAVCVTGQHRGMLDQVLDAFELRPDRDLGVMQPGQTLPGLTARLIAALEPVIRELEPSLLVVQGDTATTLCGALSAFYGRVPVAHVEAGLRTGDLTSPFPEEMNRLLTSRIAALHFAPTQSAAANLLREGVSSDSIEVTGNTGIDAVLQVKAKLENSDSGLAVPIDPTRKLIVVTAHRRESFGPAFEDICMAIARLARRDDVQIIWPVHPNPNVRSAVDRHLRDLGNVLLIDPLPYVPFIDLLSKATIILTDSGGIQEEAPSLGKPVLVLRDTTERPEAVEVGTVKLVGTSQDGIVSECESLLDDENERLRMARLHNPYGDGHASERIADRIEQFLSGQRVG